MREYRRKKKASQSEDSGEEFSQRETKSHGLAQAEAEAEADIKKTSSSSSSRGDDAKFLNTVLKFWEENDLKPTVRSISANRRSAILARRREHGEDAVLEVLENRRASNFLNNVIFEGKGAPIDWVFGPKNFPKIWDGNYNNKGGNRGTGKHKEYDAGLNR